MKINFCECPICHKVTMTEFPPSTGDSFVITEVNTKTKEFMPATGLPVKLMACTSCKTILMKNDTIEFKPE